MTRVAKSVTMFVNMVAKIGPLFSESIWSHCPHHIADIYFFFFSVLLTCWLLINTLPLRITLNICSNLFLVQLPSGNFSPTTALVASMDHQGRQAWHKTGGLRPETGSYANGNIHTLSQFTLPAKHTDDLHQCM